MILLPDALDLIDETIAHNPPERGGILLGPPGRDVVSCFVPDEDAITTNVTYTPSTKICLRTPQLEKETHLEYKGILHSHPGRMNHPSRGDCASAGKALRVNPQMSRFFMPIVTSALSAPPQDHEILLPHGALSCFVACRERNARDNGTRILSEPISIYPLRNDLLSAIARLRDSECAFSVGLNATIISFGSALGIAYTISLGADALFLVIGGEDYPLFAPQIVYYNSHERNLPLTVRWDIRCSPEERLFESIETSLAEVINGRAASSCQAEQPV